MIEGSTQERAPRAIRVTDRVQESVSGLFTEPLQPAALWIPAALTDATACAFEHSPLGYGNG